MSVDTKIYLPLWVNIHYLTLAIDKIIGNTPIKRSLYKELKIDSLRPSNKQNSWVIEFKDGARIAPTNSFEQGFELFDLIFKDNHGSTYNWFLHTSIESEDAKLISPRCSPEAILIGKSLINFFGGKVIYSDTMDDNEPDNFYEIKKGFLPKITKKQKEGSSDNRFYQFYNTLDKFPMVKDKDFTWTEEHFGFTERYVSLKKSISKAKKELLKEKLNNSIYKHTNLENKRIAKKLKM